MPSTATNPMAAVSPGSSSIKIIDRFKKAIAVYKTDGDHEAVVTRDGVLFARGGNRYHEIVSEHVAELPLLVKLEVDAGDKNSAVGKIRVVPQENEKKRFFVSKKTIEVDQTPKGSSDLFEFTGIRVEDVWIKNNVAFYKTNRVILVSIGYCVCRRNVVCAFS